MANWNAQQVIELYDSLGLSVCDDAAAIQQKLKSQEARFLKDKNNPDPATRHRADIWFKNATALRSRRDEMLGAVYESFAEVARAVVSAGVAGGMREVSPQLQQDLLQIAYRQFRLDGALADRFLTDFMRDEGLQIGKTAVRVAMVTDFEAVPGKSEIKLTWNLTSKGFDEVEIFRELVTAAGVAAKNRQEECIYRGKDTTFTDRDVALEHTYRYRMHAVSRGIEGPDTRLTTFCLGEVSGAAALWNEKHISVSWELPSAKASSHLFRRAGLPPVVRRGRNGLAPADDSTVHMQLGSRKSWLDLDVLAGVTYYYRIFAVYGDGEATAGVDVKAIVPKPPSPPTEVVALLDGVKDRVVIRWTPAADRQPSDKYVVVRTPSDVHAACPEDGTQIDATEDVACYDDSMPVGQETVYAVFVQRGENVGRAAAFSKPVLLLPDVSNVEPVPGDGEAVLRWTANPALERVQVERVAPDSHGSKRIELLGKTGAVETGLTNGQDYEYRIRGWYRVLGRGKLPTKGVTVTVTPHAKPLPVTDFDLECHDSIARMICKAPEIQQIAVVRSSSRPPWAVGSTISLDEALQDRTRLEALHGQPQVIEDLHPQPDEPFYTALTVTPPVVAVGPTKQIPAATVRWRLERTPAVKRLWRTLAGLWNELLQKPSMDKRRSNGRLILYIDGDPVMVGSLALIGKASRIPIHVADAGGRCLLKWRTNGNERFPLSIAVDQWRQQKGEVYCQLFADSPYRVQIKGPTAMNELLL